MEMLVTILGWVDAAGLVVLFGACIWWAIEEFR